jgi:hypothetical protein
MKKIFFPILLLAAMVFMAFSPEVEGLLDRLMTQLETYNKKRPQEKLYLHLDRPAYLAGDTIWAQAYLTDRLNQPWDLSKLIHVQLENDKGIPVKQWQLPVDEGFASASFMLPADLKGGLYRLKAFTNWMRNFDESTCYSTYLPIYEAGNQQDFTFQSETPIVQYFPEGGTLVRKLVSRVAVRAHNNKGKPIMIHAQVLKGEGETVTFFSTNKQGFGEFELEPQFGENYFIYVDGGVEPIPLDNIRDQGTVMRVDNSEASRITVLVQGNEPMMEAREKEALLVVYAQGTIFYAAACVLGSKRFVANFPKKDLPESVAQVVLFSGSGKVIAKRNLAIGPKPLEISLETDKSAYAPRHPVKISLSMDGGSTQSSEGQFSVSVRKKHPQSLPTLSISQQLNQQVLLGEAVSEQTSAFSLDQWMIGTTMKNIDWEEILQGDLSKPDFLFQQGPLLRGQVWRNVRPEPGCKLDAFVGEHHYSYEITTDEAGKFDVPVVDYPGEATLFFVPKSGFEPLTVVLDRQMGESFQVEKSSLSGESKTYWQQQAIRLEAGEDYRIDVSNKRNRGQRFYGMPDLVIRPEDYIPLPNMAEVLREIVPPVQVKGRPGNYKLRVVLDKEIVSFDEDPLLLIDGCPTYDPSHILSLAPEEVDRIEVMNDSIRLQRLGTIGRYGVVAVFTRSGDVNIGRQGLIIDGVPGVHQAQTFRAPVYPDPDSRKGTTPDFRATAYWNPAVKLSEKGKTEIQFDLGDDLGMFEIDIQGLTQNGKPFSVSKTFEVK